MADPFAGIGGNVAEGTQGSSVASTAQGSAAQAARRSQRVSNTAAGNTGTGGRTGDDLRRASQRTSGPSGQHVDDGLNRTAGSVAGQGDGTTGPFAGPGRFEPGAGAHDLDTAAAIASSPSPQQPPPRQRIDYEEWLRLHHPDEAGRESAQARDFLETAEPAFVRVTAVKNLPLSVAVTEVTLAFVEPRGHALLTLADVPSCRMLQDESSDSASPTFTGAAVNARVKPKAQLAVLVCCIDHRTRYCGTLGHALVPVWNRRGVFEVRLREGRLNKDPSHVSSDPAAFAYLPLTSVVVHVNVRPGEKASSGAPVRLFDFSHNEELLVADRVGKTAPTMSTFGFGPLNAQKAFDDHAHKATSGTSATGAGGNAVVVAKQQQAGGGDNKERILDIAHYAPYNDKRGIALVLHGLYYCAAAASDRSPLQLFKLVAEIDGRRVFTKDHDWAADATRPKFKTAQFVFPGVRMRPNLACIIRVYRLQFHPKASNAGNIRGSEPTETEAATTISFSSPPGAGRGSGPPAADGLVHSAIPTPRSEQSADADAAKARRGNGKVRDVGHWVVEEYGWGAISLVSPIGAGVLRHSPTSLVRLYQGRPPSNLVDVITQSDSVDYALGRLLESGDVQLYRKTVGTQSPILSLSVADPARINEIVAERRSSALPPKHVLHEVFKAHVWPNPSEIQADSNAFFKAAVFGA
jgi:hypothetical protein